MADLLMLLPEALHAFPADLETPENFARAFAARPLRDDALP